MILLLAQLLVTLPSETLSVQQLPPSPTVSFEGEWTCKQLLEHLAKSENKALLLSPSVNLDFQCALPGTHSTIEAKAILTTMLGIRNFVLTDTPLYYLVSQQTRQPLELWRVEATVFRVSYSQGQTWNFSASAALKDALRASIGIPSMSDATSLILTKSHYTAAIKWVSDKINEKNFQSVELLVPNNGDTATIFTGETHTIAGNVTSLAGSQNAIQQSLTRLQFGSSITATLQGGLLLLNFKDESVSGTEAIGTIQQPISQSRTASIAFVPTDGLTISLATSMQITSRDSKSGLPFISWLWARDKNLQRASIWWFARIEHVAHYDLEITPRNFPAKTALEILPTLPTREK